MLRLGCALRRLGAGPGARACGRLPAGAEMPKKAGATSKGKSQSKEPEQALPPLGPVAVDAKGCVTIAIHAKPGAKHNAVTVKTYCVPGKCKFLYKILSLPKEELLKDKVHTAFLPDLTTEAVSVAIAAPPSEGEANAELCRYLSKVLELRKSDVVLDKGSKSREKVVKLLASTTPEEVLEKLEKQVEKK